MTEKMDVFKAYDCMYEFLCELYEDSKNDTLGAILGDIQINHDDNLPMDLAMKEDWLAVVSLVDSNDGKLFTSSDVYLMMIEFLKELSKGIKSSDLLDLIEYLTLNQYKENVIQIWKRAVNKSEANESWNW